MGCQKTYGERQGDRAEERSGRGGTAGGVQGTRQLLAWVCILPGLKLVVLATIPPAVVDQPLRQRDDWLPRVGGSGVWCGKILREEESRVDSLANCCLTAGLVSPSAHSIVGGGRVNSSFFVDSRLLRRCQGEVCYASLEKGRWPAHLEDESAPKGVSRPR